ncbi:structural maintenance of chromosomes protein 2-like [Ruditapes philippinarum]|uniref:structural maintenance of chromosomes protein 2-like n=1 Tax=Ruditapes philippinarum TaxID=129788 RepID=UPI00295BF146|nr:structural maintenance of chromosomes protein 2-like [Ruditapes philippinarum]
MRRSSSALNIQQTIAEFKTCPLDLEEERRIQKEIKKWKDYEDDVDRLKQEMTAVKDNISDVKKDIEDVKGNVTEVKKDIEGIRKNVTEVKRDLEGVKENDTAVKRNLEGIKENVTEVKKDLEDAKENDTAMKRDIEDIKENVTDVKRDVDEFKRRQGTDETRQDRQKKGNIFQRFFERRRYNRMKTKLQGDLIKFYRKRCSSIPLSPLLEEIETPLAGFYVMPDIVAVKQKSLTCHEEERTPIKSLKDLFSTGSGDATRNVFIS